MMLTLHLRTFLKYVSLHSNNVTISIAIYYTILDLAVIESLAAFLFFLCLLVSFWLCPRIGKIHHFSVPELFGACELLCYCFSVDGLAILAFCLRLLLN